MTCGIGHRCGLDPVLPWLQHRLAVAALIQPLAWELPYAAGADIKAKKKEKQKRFLWLISITGATPVVGSKPQGQVKLESSQFVMYMHQMSF